MAVLPHEGTHNILFHSYAIPVGSSLRPGYIARPDRRGTFPAVLLVTGIFGLSPFEKDMARHFARHGFVAVVVDPYLVPVPSEASLEGAVTAYSQISDQQAMTVIDRAMEFVTSGLSDFTESQPVGLVGFDTGGRFALLYASGSTDVAAVAVAYAPLAGDEERANPVADALGRIAVPILALYGAEDSLISAESVDVACGLAPHGQWILYTGAGHDFLDVEAETYDGAAAADARTRLPKFMTSSMAATV